MELVLTVLQAPPGTLPQAHNFHLTAIGGTIGRADTSTCYLPCPERVVSSLHATIAFQEGQFVLVDTSTNGTEVNGQLAPKQGAIPLALKEGDIIKCGSFQLGVHLSTSALLQLPKGIGNADFLLSTPVYPAPGQLNPAVNNVPKSASNQGFLSVVEGSDDSLDKWLNGPAAKTPLKNQSHGTPEPSAHGWGSVADSTSQHIDPLVNMDQREPNFDNLFNKPSQNIDPSALKNTHSTDDDDWWKSSDTMNRAPGLSQHVHIDPLSSTEQPAAKTPLTKTQPSITAHQGNQNTQSNSTPSFGFSGSPANINVSKIDDVLGGLDSTASKPMTMQRTQSTYISASEDTPTKELTTSSELNTSGNFGRYLGVNPQTQLPDTQLQKVGANIIKETVSRLMGLIKARASIKNELRVQHTTLKAEDNNPLKFSVNTEDAISILFSNARNASFMSPDEAIKDSFDDLADHQLAVLAGMQAAYEHMFKQFSPSRLETIFNTKSGLLSNRRAANWEAYEHHYIRLTKDRESAYNQLFGQVFAKHYEQRLAELKSQRMLNSGIQH